MMKKLNILIFLGFSFFVLIKGGAPSIFVPRQLSYNPIFENASVLSFLHQSESFIVSAKPMYTQNVGSKFEKYFTIHNKPLLNAQENGTGDIGSLWFQVVTPTNFYSSDVSFDPKRTTFGMMLYASINLNQHVSFSINTALINTRNSMNISETNISQLGIVPGSKTITEAFLNVQHQQYGLISGTQSQSGLDDIQVKFMYHIFPNFCEEDCDNVQESCGEVYLLAGIPAGNGSQAQYLFEPLVGSNHAQIGLGGYLHYNVGKIKFQAEAKWRYAFAADEMRSFDLTKNGQWSRYLLVVNSLNKYLYYPAINDFTLLAQITPQNSFDLYCALCWNYHDVLHVEVGYDFWYRSAEKIMLKNIVLPVPSIGIADVYNIAHVSDPQSASAANISQGVILGQNNAPSDAAFIAIQPTDFNLHSAAAPQSISNSIYGTVCYTKELMNHVVCSGFSLGYECGHGINVPNNISVFITLNVSF